jgi:hypothetical protein
MKNVLKSSRPRQPLLKVLGVLALAFASGLAVSVPGSNQPASLEFSTFQIITERNIFNASRGRGSGGATTEPENVRTDNLALVGTLTYEKGPYAFFDGSSSEYRAVLEPGKTIAGCTLVEIDPDAVKLTIGTNTVELRIGMQLRRQGQGEWQVSSGGAPAANANLSVTSSSSSGNDDDDIVKKLMQQREQDLK